MGKKRGSEHRIEHIPETLTILLGPEFPPVECRANALMEVNAASSQQLSSFMKSLLTSFILKFTRR
jgi:hypothetical protein